MAQPSGGAQGASFITQVSRGATAAGRGQTRTGAAKPPEVQSLPLLLPPQDPSFSGKGLLVLDLDETLVHSSFREVAKPDFVLPVELRDQLYHVFVKKRPFVNEFLAAVAPHWEVAVFTASVPEYADPLIDRLDPQRKLIHHRLFREHCSFTHGAYVKDLDRLNRPMSRIVIVDNSPTAYLFHPQNALPILSWFEDPHDVELKNFIRPLIDLAEAPDVVPLLDHFAQVLQEGEGRAPQTG